MAIDISNFAKSLGGKPIDISNNSRNPLGLPLNWSDHRKSQGIN
jgi:hypothetical protein